jgi:hypothetical protein
VPATEGDIVRRETMGSGAEAGNLQFPLIPSRWLVLRAAYDATGAAPVLTVMVVSSDAIADPGPVVIPLTVSQYPMPGVPGTTGILGRSDPLAAWTGVNSTTAAFLRATAPGDMAWVAAYDNVRNVLSLYDPLTPGAGVFGYSVIGWYADPGSDPLGGLPAGTPKDWGDALSQRFGWSLGSGAAGLRDGQADWLDWSKARGVDNGTPDPGLPVQFQAAIARWETWRAANGEAGPMPDLPQQTLLAGLLFGVEWQGPNKPYGTGAPGEGIDYPSLAIGNTAPEAVAAWLATTLVTREKADPSTIPAIELAMTSFQAGLLNELQSDPAETQAKLHAAEFAAQGQPRLWTVVRPEVPEGAAKPGDRTEGGDASIPLNADQTAKLIALNRVQAEIDRLTGLLHGQQAEVFALAWKRTQKLRGSPPGLTQSLADAWTVMTGAVVATSAAIRKLATPDTGTLAQTRAALVTALKGAYELRQVSA